MCACHQGACSPVGTVSEMAVEGGNKQYGCGLKGSEFTSELHTQANHVIL